MFSWLKKILMMTCVFVGAHFHGFADEDAYRVFCTNVVVALSDENVLMSPSFTNQLHLHAIETNVRTRALAKLVLADSLLTMYDQSSDFAAHGEGLAFCSNVLFSANLPVRSWQKSVASIFYAWALRIDDKNELALTICNTALTSHLTSPTTDVECAVWSAMSTENGLPEMSITNSLKLAAALSVPVERRPLEWGAYTNGLPAQAIRILLE